MQKRTLGKTGLEVSEIGLGGLFVSSLGGPFERGKAATLHALELGVNYIDTAPTYGNSEESLGQILSYAEQPVILSTKLGGRPCPFDPKNKTHLRKSFEMSLKSLRREQIDILMIHEPDRPRQYEWWENWTKVEGPVLEFLAELKAEGCIRFTGLGGTTVYEMAHLVDKGDFDVLLTAFNYSLLWREAEYLIQRAKEKSMGIIIGSPLQQGALAQNYSEEMSQVGHWISVPRREQFSALYELVKESGIPLPELALRFILSNPSVSCVLTGARSTSEVGQNVRAATQGALPSEILQRLDIIADLVPYRPCEEPVLLPFGQGYKGPAPLS